MKISINEPCYENWDAMTPNTQGAFCKSCMKDVVDFSKMTLQQIKNYFADKESQKICGRFEEKQLQELSFDDFFAKFKYWNFTKKFAVIFFLTFGLSIFLNQNAVAQKEQMLKGDVAYVPEQNKEVKENNTIKMGKVKATEIKGDTAKKQPPRTTKGEVKCIKPENKQATKNNPRMIMGAMVAPPREKSNTIIKKEK